MTYLLKVTRVIGERSTELQKYIKNSFRIGPPIADRTGRDN